jgi:cytochrome c553
LTYRRYSKTIYNQNKAVKSGPGNSTIMPERMKELNDDDFIIVEKTAAHI